MRGVPELFIGCRGPVLEELRFPRSPPALPGEGAVGVDGGWGESLDNVRSTSALSLFQPIPTRGARLLTPWRMLMPGVKSN